MQNFSGARRLFQEIEEGYLDSIKSEDNVYFAILRCLCESNFGMRYRQLKRGIGKGIAVKLRKLKKEGVVDYKDKRYSLKRKELCKYLFGD